MYYPQLFANTISDEKEDSAVSLVELKKRAESGDPNAQYVYAAALIYGMRGCVINKAAGEKWLVLASKSPQSPGGMCALGECHEHGMGGVVIKNADKAKHFYGLATDRGYIHGIFLLGRILSDEALTHTESVVSGYDVVQKTTFVNSKEKMTEAIRLLNIAAEANHSRAQNRLSYLYAYGYGVTKDEETAFKLSRMAADSGDAQGKRNLGTFYENGKGTQASKSKARELFRAAKDQHQPKIEVDIERINYNVCCVIQ